MTEQEFYQAVDNQPNKADMLVRIKMKYSCDKEYEYLNVLYVFDMDKVKHVWYWDWYEGQQDVEIIGAVLLEDVDVPLFSDKYTIEKMLDI